MVFPLGIRLYVSAAKLKLFTCGICLVYVLFLITIIYFWNSAVVLSFSKNSKDDLAKVYIIGKAAIGQYFWLHIISGEITYINDGFYQIGNKIINNLNITYLSGPGYIQTSIPQEIEYIVLVLNGRTNQKVRKAQEWLDYLPHMRLLRKTAVILLGNEQCDNQWVQKYMRKTGGIIDVLFIVYDSSIVNNNDIFQWPLGVATYRGFPILNKLNSTIISKRRSYKCNFVGTVYRNSSRETLTQLLKNSFKDLCLLIYRDTWVPEETSSSLQNYVKILLDSDLTLCPVGINTESYRIYEALSTGSIPVVENRLTPGKCVTPLRLFKKYNAPIIYVNDWKQLYQILLYEQKMNFSYILERRNKSLNWYLNFKQEILLNFIINLEKIFFDIKFSFG